MALSFYFFTGKISVYLQKEAFFIRLGENNFTSYVSTLRTLYCALVKSQLEFGSVVWPPFTDRNITKLERVQRRATEFILKTEDDYEVCMSELNLLSLEHRRFIFDVLFFFYKALNGYTDIDMSAYVQFYSDTSRYSLC